MAHNKSFNLAGEEYVGQDVDGATIEHLGVDDKGFPIRQARIPLDGGEVIAHQGDYIVTFPNGERSVISAKAWDHKAPEAKPAPKPKSKPKPAPKSAVVNAPTTSPTLGPFGKPFGST